MSVDQVAQIHHLQATITTLEASLDAIAEGVVWVGADRRIQWSNAAFDALVERSHDAVVGAMLPELLPLCQNDCPIAPAHYPDLRLWQGDDQRTDYQMVGHDQQRTVQITGRCLAVSPTETLAILVLQDVTQAKRLEQAYQRHETALHEAEGKYRSIFEHATQGIFQTLPDGRCIAANPALARISGYDSPQELMDSPTTLNNDVYVDPQRRQDFLRQMHEQGVITNMESQIYRKDGTVIWISESARVVRDERGQPLYYEGFVEDITERKQAEQEQEETLALLKLTLESTADGILVVNRERNVPLFNQKFVQMWAVPDALLQPDTGDARLRYLADQTVDPEGFIIRVWDLFCNHPEQESLDLLEFKDGRVIERYSQAQWRGDRVVGRVWSYRDVTERKRSEDALRRTNTLLKAQQEASIDGILVLDEHQQVVSYNQRFCQIWRLSPSFVQGNNGQQLCDCVVEQVVEPARFTAPIAILYDHPDAVHHDEIILTDGRTLERYSAGVRSPSGEYYGRIWSFRDMSDRKRSEYALQQSEARLQAIIDNANAAIFMKDLNGVYVLANRKFAEEMNLPVDAILGKSDYELLPPELADHYRINDERALAARGAISIDNVSPISHGDCVFVTVKFPLFNPDQTPYAICGISTDITDRKQAEAALRRSELKYRNIFETSQVGIGRTRLADGLFIDVNQRCAEILGYASADAVIGRCFATDFYANPSDRQYVLDQIKQQGELSNFEVSLRAADGTMRWILLASRLNVDEQCLDFVIADISDRKRLEEELRRSQQFLDSIINSVPIALFVKDITQDFRYVLLNQTAERMLGFSSEMAIGKNDYELVPSGTADYYRYEDQRVLDHGTLLEIPDHWIETPDERFLARGWKRPLFDPAGNVTYLLAISEDITERWHQEQALRLIVEGTAAKTGDEFFESCVRYLAEVLRVRYALVAKFVDDDRTKAQTLATFGEGLFASLVEYDVQGTPCEQVLQGDLCYYADQLQQSFPHDPSVSELHLESYLGIPLTNSAGEILGHLAVMDVKPMAADPGRELIIKIFAARAGAELERKQADIALQQRAQIDSLLSSISRQLIDQPIDIALEFSLAAIAHVVGADRCCMFEYLDQRQEIHLVHEWCAPTVTRLTEPAVGGVTQTFPWLSHHILAGHITQISHVSDLPPEAIAEKRLFESQSIRSLLAVPMVHSGAVVGFLGADVVHHAKTWHQDDINLLRLVGELLAIGRARYQAEEALRVAKDAAEAANRAKSAFLANMSHELRTPLNAILGFAQLMERDVALQGNQREFLSTINRSGEHLLELINDVLEMSKIEAGRTVLHATAFDLHRLLDTIVEMFQMRVQAKQLAFEVAIASPLPQYVLTDEGKLRQVLINLLSNAVKFTQQGQITLQVRAEQLPEDLLDEAEERRCFDRYTLWFDVIDTGRGIAPEEMVHLFQPFVQTMSGAEAREGTGLGLTISRQFVQLMGGDITVTSALGQGSTFSFNVQVQLAAATEVEMIRPLRRVLGLAPHQPTYRILVVDDRQENRELIEQLLTTVGFETLVAANGAEAIAQWQTHHPHLIWMDMRMPVLNGYAATRQIRALEAVEHLLPTIIIALTASAFEEQRTHILAAGCDDFVRKPFQESVIFDKMAHYLGVRYCYADESVGDASLRDSGATAAPLSAALTRADLAALSSDQLASLHQAALEVDADCLLQVIEQIAISHGAIASGLTDLVRRFDFDTILELTQA